MIEFNAKEDIANRRKVLLNGKVVTIIDLAGRQAKIAEDGKWYPHNMFFPLTEEHIAEDAVSAISSHLFDKKIAVVKPEGAGVHIVMEDNTRFLISYSSQEGIEVGLFDANGSRVV